MLRISTSQFYETGLRGIQDNQNALYRLQNQVNTGRRILTPEDDPIGASEALQISQSKAVNAQYVENQGTAAAQLNLLESTLGSAGNELQSIYERALQAGNGSYDSAQRGMIASELKQRMQNLLGLANTQDGGGLYIFGGFKANSQPFAVTGSGGNYHIAAPAKPYVTYSGDAGRQEVAVSGSQTVATNESGLDVFMQVRDANGALTGRSVFDSLQNMIDILDPASGIPYNASTYRQSLNDLGSAVDHVATRRANVGARLQALGSMTAYGKDLALQYDQRLSEVRDLDYAKALSEQSQVYLQLQAAQQIFKTSSQLSLFNML